MSKLEELIKEFCPNGVEYVKIGSVVNYEQPSQYLVKKADYKEEYSTPVLTAGQTFILGYTNEMNGIYNASKDSPVIIFDDFTGAFKWVDFPFKVKSSAIKFLKANEKRAMLRYIFHVMGNINLTSTEHKRLWIGIYSELQIPLPALPVQREIVRVLDSFTLYSAELTAELTARRKQYEFYRDKLLNFDSGNIQRVKLKDICGKVSNIKWQNDDNEYAYIDLSSVDRETHKITIEQRINKENAPSRAQQIVNKGDVLFATTRPTLKRYCKITEEFNGQICSTGFVVLRPKINIILSTYLYYIVSSDRFFTYVEKNQEGTSYPAISDSKVKEFDFSLPPMEVQERIVRVLDNFDAICSDLGIGLPAEIEKRQKQYEYYREKLLTFDGKYATILTERNGTERNGTERNGTERAGLIRLLQYVYGFAFVRLGDIAIIERGGNFQKKDFVNEGYPCIHYGQIYTKYGISAKKTIAFISNEVAKKSKQAKPNDIIMAVTSENVEDVCKCVVWLGNENIAVSGHTAIIHSTQNAKYLAYYFCTSMFFEQKKKYLHGTKVIEVTPSDLANIVIPLPTLEKQKEIVEILDKFDSICNDLSAGLPAEIEYRQKQYEYYRDKLLTFEGKNNNGEK